MAEVRRAIIDERAELAELLTGFDRAAWDAPTLCRGWRVREVVAHITVPFRLTGTRFAVEFVRAGGNFDRIAHRIARVDAAAMPSGELLKSLWDNVGHPWRPPGCGAVHALGHDIVHGLDITVALGLDRKVPHDRLRLVLDLINPRCIEFFGTDLTGVELRADDLDWSYGTGAVVTGNAQDLLLVACGRTLPARRLRGDLAARFTRSRRRAKRRRRR
ncbi:maleylpyruvate isomerase family mycothiol-dependent enzyme [Nocardia brasiliensis]|uniref:Mycothiol-dependent maleylpyruvate isomerase metal-binding domain-containing protein n=1 Tax=Nocardia brasiliensis (strain ATCC 700358 / HUJEG-1) TaxID=1133849 RepID=K0F177_NOCB7|nr:maleylpyruvate isomerase family mycothiol-dependent enzyme [Nocardia brasiliensis]AFU01441.1 hypothetical protein O3I_017400 [Nocardia brasiliensis ATCC 700358]OCF86771.1 hypothetical protein AW168_30470 [Nocardia brasiliensis]